MAFSIAEAYPWIKSLHVASVILWMGAQFLLPALLMGHRDLPPSSPKAEGLLQVERWLVGRIMNPAMVAAFVFGGLLAGNWIGESWNMPGWLWLKLGAVLVLAALHGRMLRQYWRAADGRARWEEKSYRWVQGLDFALLAAVVVLVVAKPLA